MRGQAIVCPSRLLSATTAPATEQSVFEAVISSAAVDREKGVVSPAVMVRAMQKWTPTGKRLPLTWNHSREPEKQIGHMDPTTARVVGDEVQGQGVHRTGPPAAGREAWRLVKLGVLGFSFGYMTLKASPLEGGDLPPGGVRRL